MDTIRLGAVSYLNARPLTWALDHGPAAFDYAQARKAGPHEYAVRYDLPSVCATLLAAGEIDLGLVPSIEYLQNDAYRFVPDVGIGSRGPVASVALFAKKPIADVRTIALDASSRTSVALIKVLCRHRFRIEPEYVPHPPDLPAMVRQYDAGLLIGDPALEFDPEPLGLIKLDLGLQWTDMTGLPFVYAAWTGRAGAATAADVAALQSAQEAGVASFEAIAQEYGQGDGARTARAARYLRDNMRYGLDADAVKGLQLFLDYAADLGLGPKRRTVDFF